LLFRRMRRGHERMAEGGNPGSNLRRDRGASAVVEVGNGRELWVEAGNQLVGIGPSINGRRSEMRHESAGISIHTFNLQQQIPDALKAT
jgi:hypothetical protein